MVRKRTRKYESDENDSDSDVDFAANGPSRPAPKKYSLRERKRAPILTADYDYYGLDEEDGEGRRGSSDDEDFEVEADVEGARSYFEPEAEQPSAEGGLIDFEDIIRADIVVNKNKIDYDNLIQKTEIKLSQPKKKRGRKPKYQVVNEEVKTEEAAPTEHVCEPDLGTLTQLEQGDEQEAKPEPPENVSEGPAGLPNGEASHSSENEASDVIKTDVSDNLENGETSKESDPPTTNEEVNGAPPKSPPPIDTSKVEENEEDDDVIVLGEVNQDVIVLDD